MNDPNIKQDTIKVNKNIREIRTTPQVYDYTTNCIYRNEDDYNVCKHYNETGNISAIFQKDTSSWENRSDLDYVTKYKYDKNNNIIEILTTSNFHSWGDSYYNKIINEYDNRGNVIEEKSFAGEYINGEYVNEKLVSVKSYKYTYDKFKNWTQIRISDISYENGKEVKNDNHDKVISRIIEYYYKNGDFDFS